MCIEEYDDEVMSFFVNQNFGGDITFSDPFYDRVMIFLDRLVGKLFLINIGYFFTYKI